MTDEEILAAAEATGLKLFGLGMDKAKFEFCILAFAKFAGKIERFKEREACAKVCDELPAPNVYSDSDKGMWDITSLACGDAIRARGEKA